MAVRVVPLLEVEPDLGDRMETHARGQATELIRARVFAVRKGRWEPPTIDRATMGLLLLDGLMVRTVRLGDVCSSEIVGPSDIIRPWENDLLPSFLPDTGEWRVLETARVALLDGRVTALIGRWPELNAAVAGRFLRRTRSLAYLMAAQHFLRVEDRLLATLWHLASMWGRVTRQGTVIPFRLTHETLAELVGARRPTTTTAIHSLRRQGRLAQDNGRRFVLSGDPPDWTRSHTPRADVEV